MKPILLDKQDDAVKRFFQTLPNNSQGCVVELNGRAVACVVSIAAPSQETEARTEAKNERRCDLIEKEIDGILTSTLAAELETLQEAMYSYRCKVSPLPIAAVWKLRDELVAGIRNRNA